MLEAFTELGVRWCVLRAQVVNVHGHSRMTADIDETAELGATAAAELVETLERFGFRPAFEFDDAFVSANRVVPVVHSSAMPVDTVLAGPGLEEIFLDEAETTKIAGVVVAALRSGARDVSKIKRPPRTPFPVAVRLLGHYAINLFFNSRLRHSSLGYVSPAVFEATHQHLQQAAIAV